MKYKKYRELSVDINKIQFKKIVIKEIINYFPAGNDVIEAKALMDDKIVNVVIKIERSKMANFVHEYHMLNKLKNKLPTVPKVIETGKIVDKNYIVLEKKAGERLSIILKNDMLGEKILLKEYGSELARIHKLDIKGIPLSFKRNINNLATGYRYYDSYSKKIILWLKNNSINMDDETFIHGDFHYGNILFKYNKVSAILDFEYSGRGFKEQDIAWACVLRPSQNFMDSIDDLNMFLNGYKEYNNFNYEKFKWCYINSSIHFYLINIKDEKYKNKIKKMINLILEGGI